MITANKAEITEVKPVRESIILTLLALDEAKCLMVEPEYVDVLISALRTHAGETGESLSERLGLSQASISYYESKERNINVDTLHRLVEATGYRLSLCIERLSSEEIRQTSDNAHVSLPNDLATSFLDRFKK